MLMSWCPCSTSEQNSLFGLRFLTAVLTTCEPCTIGQGLAGKGLERRLEKTETGLALHTNFPEIHRARGKSKAYRLDLLLGKCDMSTKSGFGLDLEECCKIKELLSPNFFLKTRLGCGLYQVCYGYHTGTLSFRTSLRDASASRACSCTRSAQRGLQDVVAQLRSKSESVARDTWATLKTARTTTSTGALASKNRVPGAVPGRQATEASRAHANKQFPGKQPALLKYDLFQL